MPFNHIVKESTVSRSARVMQLEGLFDLPASKVNRVSWDLDVDVNAKPWNVGLIVGPSGSGKTTISQELFPIERPTYKWSKDRTIIDDFPEDMSITEIVELLSRIGFSSPPSWLRPHHVLSNGEQFRVDIARVLADKLPLTVVDEFSSVVDRTVAKVSSQAIAKTVRYRETKFVAVSCHYDIIDWLQPDWIIEPAADSLTSITWRALQRRPEIPFTIKRVHPAAWDLFRHHHYLTSAKMNSSHCYVGYIDDVPVAFLGVQSFPHPIRPGWRQSRVVCLPDYQGLGIGTLFSDYVGSLYASTSRPFRMVLSHPALVSAQNRNPKWVCIRKMSRLTGGSTVDKKTGRRIRSSALKLHTGKDGMGTKNRATASFLYVGPDRIHDGLMFGIPPSPRYAKQARDITDLTE